VKKQGLLFRKSDVSNLVATRVGLSPMISEKRVVQAHQAISRCNGDVATVKLQFELFRSKVQSPCGVQCMLSAESYWRYFRLNCTATLDKNASL